MHLRRVIQLLAAALALVGSQRALAEGAREIAWKELAPASDVEKLASMQVMALLRAAPHGAADDVAASMQAIQPGMYGVIDELDGELIALSGFDVPLDFDRGASREFLLVPYYGACIHAPPPPPNQTVLVRSKTPVKLGALSNAYVAAGTLRVAQNSSSMGDSAYLLELTSLSRHK